LPWHGGGTPGPPLPCRLEQFSAHGDMVCCMRKQSSSPPLNPSRHLSSSLAPPSLLPTDPTKKGRRGETKLHQDPSLYLLLPINKCIHERDAAIKRPTKTPSPTDPLLRFAPSPNLPLPQSVSLVVLRSAHEDQEAASGPAYRLPAALRSIPRAPVVAAACVARSSGAPSSASGSGGQAARGGGVALAPRNK
jgi:hypothetical protein